jgi:hypothetical protein
MIMYLKGWSVKQWRMIEAKIKRYYQHGLILWTFSGTANGSYTSQSS